MLEYSLLAPIGLNYYPVILLQLPSKTQSLRKLNQAFVTTSVCAKVTTDDDISQQGAVYTKGLLHAMRGPAFEQKLGKSEKSNIICIPM